VGTAVRLRHVIKLVECSGRVVVRGSTAAYAFNDMSTTITAHTHPMLATVPCSLLESRDLL